MDARTGWLVENGTGTFTLTLSAFTSYSDARRRAEAVANERQEIIYLVETTTGGSYSSGVFGPK